ncbi:MAG: protein translocase subunit SecD [Candidatus Colwellbacteria bacterium CG10_big_fil_rev_8_21_14_0_10_42_22]|uniref:Protein translocase subunit SecD n=1 Tax=Candidatus Colwellbacteria bacterium CG10_big_fil_rev_8_21_14_0_10_42_22 TaxID=1974540 RepID=A0A2H0VGA7_9BACT|nr:MAG: protein translocase subunit SecD [Candidatus Colwellbacteria bacterium CG10_big_fil_rev_8_21_14_0_10_42_22]
MDNRKKSIWILLLVLVIAFLSGFFIYSGNKISDSIPWKLGLDIVGGSALVYEIDLSEVAPEDYANTVTGLKEVIERRVSIYGVAEPRVATAKKGDSYQLLVELAGVDAENAARQIGETPVLEFREVELMPDGSTEYKPTELTGRYIQRASIGADQYTNSLLVLLDFDEEGAQIFADLTERNVGKPLAVFLDGASITEPIVQQKIIGGTAQITGGGYGFSQDEARQLVERFNAGALSAPIKQINQRKVSASAAENSLNQIILAGLIGTAMVLVFMILYYRSFGLYASIALLIYTTITLGIFKLIPGFTMTLAGIAGFVLSIGMAVDANILIFERTKEEIKAGHSRIEAINEGFKRAWPSIRDSNTTTILTSIILYAFTSSFVRGFALTLGLGVLISMFSAIFVTRTILRVFTKQI